MLGQCPSICDVLPKSHLLVVWFEIWMKLSRQIIVRSSGSTCNIVDEFDVVSKYCLELELFTITANVTLTTFVT